LPPPSRHRQPCAVVVVQPPPAAWSVRYTKRAMGMPVRRRLPHPALRPWHRRLLSRRYGHSSSRPPLAIFRYFRRVVEAAAAKFPQ
jgi:hypothetical protein